MEFIAERLGPLAPEWLDLIRSRSAWRKNSKTFTFTPTPLRRPHALSVEPVYSPPNQTDMSMSETTGSLQPEQANRRTYPFTR
jgi:hypothetical protein